MQEKESKRERERKNTRERGMEREKERGITIDNNISKIQAIVFIYLFVETDMCVF